MKNEIILSKEATSAVVRSVLSGPNCCTNRVDRLREYLKPKKETSLSELSLDLENGPVSFLVAYAVLNRKSILEISDVVNAYCFGHINMVRATEQIFKEQGISDPYFLELQERGFCIKNDMLPEYLYSCIGKTGQITARNGSLTTVKSGQCVLENVLLDEGSITDFVVIHFATVLSMISKKEAHAIQKLQRNNKWFLELETSLSRKRINYAQFCEGDLTRFTLDRIHL